MAEETPAQPEPAKSSSKKTMIMVAVILVVEAVGIIGVMKFLGGGPAPVHANEHEATPEKSEDDKIVETQVLKAQMPNNKSGVTYVYDSEIYVQVKQKHVGAVDEEIEQFQNEIKAEITAIWRIAEPQYFQEPKLENLTRKVYAMLNERFGNDKESSEPIITKCVIVMSTGFRIDN